MAGTHKDDKLQSKYARTWVLVSLLILTVISSAYTAVLTTFLLSKEIHLPVTEVQELLTEPMGTTRASSQLKYLREVEGFRNLLELNLEEAASEANSGRIKGFLGTRVSLEYIANHNCSVYVPNSN